MGLPCSRCAQTNPDAAQAPDSRRRPTIMPRKKQHIPTRPEGTLVEVSTSTSSVVGVRRWPDKIWARRYNGIIVSDEPEEQWARLKYVLGQGAKEDLVKSPLEWTGLHAARPLVEGGHLRPKSAKSSPAPRFHAKSRESYDSLVAEYREFLMNYRAAAEELRSSELGSKLGFPTGCYPPALPLSGPFMNRRRHLRLRRELLTETRQERSSLVERFRWL